MSGVPVDKQAGADFFELHTAAGDDDLFGGALEGDAPPSEDAPQFLPAAGDDAARGQQGALPLSARGGRPSRTGRPGGWSPPPAEEYADLLHQSSASLPHSSQGGPESGSFLDEDDEDDVYFDAPPASGLLPLAARKDLQQPVIAGSPSAAATATVAALNEAGRHPNLAPTGAAAGVQGAWTASPARPAADAANAATFSPVGFERRSTQQQAAAAAAAAAASPAPTMPNFASFSVHTPGTGVTPAAPAPSPAGLPPPARVLSFAEIESQLLTSGAAPASPAIGAKAAGADSLLVTPGGPPGTPAAAPTAEAGVTTTATTPGGPGTPGGPLSPAAGYQRRADRRLFQQQQQQQQQQHHHHHHHHQQQHQHHHHQHQHHASNGAAASPSGESARTYRPTNYRRWRENRQRMSADEIDSILRMQYYSLQSENAFVEDYYYQMALLKRKQQPLAAIPTPAAAAAAAAAASGGSSTTAGASARAVAIGEAVTAASMLTNQVTSSAADLHMQASHKPICLSTPRPQRKGINLDGALGIIPSHSVRAPRQLLQIDNSERDSEVAARSIFDTDGGKSERAPLGGMVHSMLLALEDAFNVLIDVEDLDAVLLGAASAAAGGGQPSLTQAEFESLMQKRRMFCDELFKAFHLHVIPLAAVSLAPKDVNPATSILIYPQDEFFLRVMQIPKGKRLLARSFLVLPPEQMSVVLMFFIRNFNYLLRNLDFEKSDPLDITIFSNLMRAIVRFDLPHLVSAMQSIHLYHPGHALQFILARTGQLVLYTLLRRTSELPPTSFSAQPIIANTWRDSFNSLFAQLGGRLETLFAAAGPDDRLVNATWDLLTLLALLAAPEQRGLVFLELRERMRTALTANPWSSARALLTVIGVAPSALQ